jgi:hypothetical protein
LCLPTHYDDAFRDDVGLTRDDHIMIRTRTTVIMI